MKSGTKIDRWKRIQDIFEGAVELQSSERRDFLAEACGDDENLRHEVASLLANDSDDAPILHAFVANNLRGLAKDSCSSDIGSRIGPYRLIRELSGGGMGVVYLAVRSDDHYFQMVALKTVRSVVISPALLQRFRVERQILATLVHPNIGTILDGGDTDDGRPYLVMEYVEGQPITLASETRGLTIRQRIELFRSVCAAVQYAHRKFVVHRDIKPSNVLVTSEGIVKLIDFGIAKPLAPQVIPGDFVPTEAGQRLMTPDYASPEQVLGKELTTTSDIYSMGVLLFELLTGSRPYSLRDLSPAAAERVICERENPKPSSIPGLPKKAKKLLDGDLDRIVLMAMEKEPSRRYPSVDDLDQDLLRFLEGRPIGARRSTPIYRLNRFFSRHKTVSLMAGATAVVLAGSILFFALESRAADAKLKQVQTLADAAISDMMQKLQQSSASVELQASVFRSTVAYLNQLTQESGNDPHLLLKLSQAYRRAGDLEGSPVAASLGNTGSAVTSYREALRAAISARSRMPGEQSSRAVIEALQQLGLIEFVSGSLPEARDHYRQAITLSRELSGQKPADPLPKRLLALNYSGLGYVQLFSLETEKAVESLRTALRVLGAEPVGIEDHDRILTIVYGRLGLALNELGKNAEAIASQEKGLEIAQALVRTHPSRNATRQVFALYNNMVGTLAGREILNAGEVAQATIYAHKAVALAEQLATGDPTNAQARSDLAGAYIRMGDSLWAINPAKASEWYRKSIALTKELGSRSDAPRGLADREETLAAVLVTKAQEPERLHLLQEANTLRQEIAKTSPHSPLDRVHLMRSYCRLSDAEMSMAKLADARSHADLSLPFFGEFKTTSPSLLVLRDLGFCYETLGNVQHAIAADRSFAPTQRRTAEIQASQWYLRSLDAWMEWVRRGAATPDSEAERHKLERRLHLK
jgi:eukaryotic-like serine/threonine-protein kinase